MKSNRCRNIIISVLVVILILNCTVVKAVSKFSISKSRVTILVGAKMSVRYKAPSKIKVTSSNKKIAKAKIKRKYVQITGIRPGLVKIKVKCKKKTKTIRVTVKKKHTQVDIEMVEYTCKPTCAVTVMPVVTHVSTNKPFAVTTCAPASSQVPAQSTGKPQYRPTAMPTLTPKPMPTRRPTAMPTLIPTPTPEVESPSPTSEPVTSSALVVSENN